LNISNASIPEVGNCFWQKKFHEEEIRRGIEQLSQSGLKLDDGSPALVARLEEQLGKGRESDLAIVFSLGKIVDSAAAALCCGWKGERRTKISIKRSVVPCLNYHRRG
jgi:hypothetical protein